jgi:hypothetical protein
MGLDPQDPYPLAWQRHHFILHKTDARLTLIIAPWREYLESATHPRLR